MYKYFECGKFISPIITHTVSLITGRKNNLPPNFRNHEWDFTNFCNNAAEYHFYKLSNEKWNKEYLYIYSLPSLKPEFKVIFNRLIMSEFDESIHFWTSLMGFAQYNYWSHIPEEEDDSQFKIILGLSNMEWFYKRTNKS